MSKSYVPFSAIWCSEESYPIRDLDSFDGTSASVVSKKYKKCYYRDLEYSNKGKKYAKHRR